MTPKRQRFVDEYLVDLNATQAAIRAGYSKKSAKSVGQRMLTFADVATAIDAKKVKRAEKVEVKAEEVLRELQTFGHFDPKECFDAEGRLLSVPDMPERARRAVQSFEVEEIWGGAGKQRAQIGELKKVKFWNKPQGLELLGKHIRLFGDEGNIGVVNVFQVKTEQLTVQLDYARLTVDEHRTLVELLNKATPPVKNA